MSGAIDLNADVGEYGDWPSEAADRERILLRLVTTAHVACGFHAGDAETMGRTVEACREYGVVVGAHPSYPDREGFGRREMRRTPAQIADDVIEQLGSLGEVAGRLGADLRSVKAHGALYNRMAVEPECAAAVAGAVAAFDVGLALVIPGTSAARRGAASSGLTTVVEGFCDRAYRSDGTLVPRSTPGAVIDDPARASRQAVGLATGAGVASIDGGPVQIACRTLCIHGDHPRAIETATAVRAALERTGVEIASFVDQP